MAEKAFQVKTEIRQDGLAEIDRVLSELPYTIARKVLRSALRKGANKVKNEAKARAPVDTGRGRASIMAKAMPSSRKSDGLTVTINVGPSKKGFYLRWAELGKRGQTPTPFLRPALDAKSAEVVRDLGSDVAKAIRREANRRRGPIRVK